MPSRYFAERMTSAGERSTFGHCLKGDRERQMVQFAEGGHHRSLETPCAFEGLQCNRSCYAASHICFLDNMTCHVHTESDANSECMLSRQEQVQDAVL